MTTASIVIEVCVEGVQGALTAAAAGAHRIELCSGLLEGGLTPSAGLVQEVCERTPLPVMVMIRPRGGDFCYSNDELCVMERDVESYREFGVRGFVWGCLDSLGNIDREAHQRLAQRAGGLPVTFHRAFDFCRDPLGSLQTLQELGVARVLTSGGAVSASAGIEQIQACVNACGEGLSMLAGGGVNATNGAEIVRRSGVRELHLSAGSTMKSSAWRPESCPILLAPTVVPEEGTHRVTDPHKIEQLIEQLKEFDDPR